MNAVIRQLGSFVLPVIMCFALPWLIVVHPVITASYGPMILGVITLQVGEAILFASVGIALLAILFFGMDTMYFIYLEEPGLEKRFGREYIEYRKKVPGWIPRLKPWRPI